MTPAADEASIRAALQAGMEHHDAGRLAQAEALYREALRAAPGRPDAMVLLADVAHRTGRDDEALALLHDAIRANPAVAQFHNKLGLVLEGRGRPDEAAAAYRRALQCQPQYAEAYFNLGNALKAQGRRDEALASYRRAVAARPGYAEAHNNLGVELHAQGRIDEALAAYRAALAARENPASRTNFARGLAQARLDPGDAALRALVARALREAWARPSDVAGAAIRLLLADPQLAAPIHAALRSWPAALPAHALFGFASLATLSNDALLGALLENAQVCDWSLERFLTLARHALLEAASDREGGAPFAEQGLGFACALARQCFLNDYVFCADEAQMQRAHALHERLAAALREGADIPAAWIPVVGAYFPLHSVAGAEALAERSWPEAVCALIVQQVAEPAVERELRAVIPRLGAVADDVSRRVQRQYEENPYPRWTKSAATDPLSLEAGLRELFAHVPLAPPIADADILVAGCGTGHESVALARQFPRSRLLAIDLSLASLAYAARKTGELGIGNVEYAQADILGLGTLGRTFDLISSVGVLHHLADPLAGWRELLGLLRPGGFMQVGLYSETGRRDLAAARRLIAERGYAPTPEGIRACRRELLESGNFPRLAALHDLYGMNECRDLLFHEQEHRFTLAQVGDMVAQLGLEFIGLAVEPAVAQRYGERFPADAQRRDLGAWHAFEREFPDTFAGMYLFWVRKPPAPAP